MVAGLVMGKEEPPYPDPNDLVIDYNDPESVLHAAAMFDDVGEWERAISLYETVSQTWPEHSIYARNCIAAIQEKSNRS
jgi:hypothetical protein